MGLNIKNVEVERLATEVAAMAGESKTEAIRQALLERRLRLNAHAGVNTGRAGLLEYLEREVWPHIPASVSGSELTRDEEDKILGIGPEGF